MFIKESTSVTFLGAYDLSREKGWIDTPKNSHSYCAISIRIKGKTKFYINDEKISVGVGDIVMIPSNIGYSQYTDGEHIYAIHFNSVNFLNADTIKKHTVKDWDNVCDLFLQICVCYTEKPKGWYYKASALLYELLRVIHLETDAQESKLSDSIDNAANYLEEHYTDHSLTITTLAEISGYTEAYFRRLFLSRFGYAPCERINYLRLERAKRMLEARTYTMAEIAEYIGIDDPKYFSTWFKKHTSISPRNYISRLGG